MRLGKDNLPEVMAPAGAVTLRITTFSVNGLNVTLSITRVFIMLSVAFYLLLC